MPTEWMNEWMNECRTVLIPHIIFCSDFTGRGIWSSVSNSPDLKRCECCDVLKYIVYLKYQNYLWELEVFEDNVFIHHDELCHIARNIFRKLWDLLLSRR
jgi:hypothetical protein